MNFSPDAKALLHLPSLRENKFVFRPDGMDIRNNERPGISEGFCEPLKATGRKVVADGSLEDFLKKFKGAYGINTEIYYGIVP
jgi:hypothetical protein